MNRHGRRALKARFPRVPYVTFEFRTPGGTTWIVDEGKIMRVPSGGLGSVLGGQSVGQGSEPPPWVRDLLGGAFLRGPAQDFTAGGGFPNFTPGSPMGPISDVTAGMNGMPGSTLFGGYGQWPAMAQGAGQMFNQMGTQGGMNAYGANASLGLNQMSDPNGGNANNSWLGSLTRPSYGAAMDYAGPAYGMISGRTGGQPSAFSGAAEPAALSQMANTGPNGDIYNRTLAMLTPQVRSSYAARGLGGSGVAANAESTQAQQLADSFAQRAMQERIGLLGQAVGGEGANASMTGALGNTAASMLNTRLNGSLNAARLPGQVLNDFMGVTGQNIGNSNSLAGLNMTPLQAGMQGQNLSMQGLQEPIALANQLYSLTRSPYLSLLQAGSGASPLGRADSYRGIFGIPKG